MPKFKTPTLKNFVDGFKYEAWVGYKWEKVVYPKTGFSSSQLQEAIDDGLVRVKITSQSQEIVNSN